MKHKNEWSLVAALVLGLFATAIITDIVDGNNQAERAGYAANQVVGTDPDPSK
jgi:hypothetical protein